MTLTETVFWTKIASRFFILGIVLLVGGYYGYLYFINIGRTPDLIFRANYACGTLPVVDIEEQPGIDISNIQIKVDALSSALPADIPYISYVYKLDVKGETFKTRDDAFAIATQLNFVAEDAQKTPGSTTYTWRNKLKRNSLSIDTANLNLTYVYDEATIPSAPNLKLPATTFSAPELAQNVLSALGLYTSDFANGKAFALPVTMTGGKSYQAKSLEKAQLLRVDLQKTNTVIAYDRGIVSTTYAGPKNIDFEGFLELAPEDGTSDKKYYQYTTRRIGKTPETSNVQVYLRDQSGNANDGVHQVIFNNWKVEDRPCGTYTLIRPADAVSRIQKGEGKIVLLVENGGDTLQPPVPPAIESISLDKIELFYYETMTAQPFLQPIYVATGEVIFQTKSRGSIAIYVPAIDYQAVSK